MSTRQTPTDVVPGLARRTVRLDPHNLDEITRRAEVADVDTSHMIRRMLAFAARHMPPDWLPSSDASAPGVPAARRG